MPVIGHHYATFKGAAVHAAYFRPTCTVTLHRGTLGGGGAGWQAVSFTGLIPLVLEHVVLSTSVSWQKAAR